MQESDKFLGNEKELIEYLRIKLKEGYKLLLQSPDGELFKIVPKSKEK